MCSSEVLVSEGNLTRWQMNGVPEVGQNAPELRIQENIMRLQVSVDDSVVLQHEQHKSYLSCDVLNLLERQLLVLLPPFIEVASERTVLSVFKQEVEVVVVVQSQLQLQDVRVRKLEHYLLLSLQFLSDCFVICQLLVYLFYRVYFVRNPIMCLLYYTIRTFPEDPTPGKIVR